MAQIAFILLCHKDPAGIVRQAQELTAAGDCVAIHFDARAPRAAFDMIRAGLADNPNVAFARKRIRCGWGGWSLVAATLLAVEAAVEAFPRATHFYMLSGDCMAIKSSEYARAFLDAEEADYIESFDFFESDWIKTGLKEERLIYRHVFNERSQKRLFYGSVALQRRLGLRRRVPADLQIMIGSQWWCLRRRTIEFVLDFIRSRPDVMRFFRTTWIPDETFFQTLVRHLVPDSEIRTRTLTFLMFTDYGMPVTLYNDHYDLLLSQDCLFARKISPEAAELKARLGALWSARGVDFAVSNEGRRLFRFLTERGRIGRRFAPRFWEAGTRLGRDRELLVVVCKKWHVAKRFAERVRREAGVPAIDYLFNEAATDLPDLGGIENGLAKRMRHRRAILRMLFDHFASNRLVICLDPSAFDLLQDFAADRAQLRILEIGCNFTDDYLIGHARRVGLAAEQSARETLDRLLPTIRYDLRFESDRIRDADFPWHRRYDEGTAPEVAAPVIAEFLGCSTEAAHAIASTSHLFTD